MTWFSNDTNGEGRIFGFSERVPGDVESLEVGDSVVALSPAKLSPLSGTFANIKARAAQVTLEDGDIRFRLDGGDPTGTEGHQFLVGTSLSIVGTQTLRQFRAIRSGTTNGTLRITFFY